MDKSKTKAIGMVSGGLDSAVAVGLIKAQGIEVVGVHYLNGFSADYLRAEVKGLDVSRLIQKRKEVLSEYFGVEVLVFDVAEEFLDVLLKPMHGYGSNANPCLDCRIFLLRKAKGIMEQLGASFVFTGEVLGQRPMSQHRKALDIVEKESGLDGLLIRPLCARLLPPTEMEKKGIVNREDLLDIQGRSRRRQMELVSKLGYDDFIQPAGGCVLTDENYGRRFFDFISNEGKEEFTRSHAVLLFVGRHFRLPNGARLVVGRNKLENEYIEREWSSAIQLTTDDVPGPTTLLMGDTDDKAIELSARITARYSDGKYNSTVRVSVKKDGQVQLLEVPPEADEVISNLRI